MIKKTVLFFLLIIFSLNLLAETITFASIEKIPYIGENIESKGYVYELVQKIFSRKGYNVKINFYPEARAIHMAKQGMIDGVLPLSINESFNNYFEFSDPFPGNAIVLLKLKNNSIHFHSTFQNNPKDFMNELKKYRIGFVKNSFGSNLFNDNYQITKDFTNSDQHNLIKLAKKRVDMIVIDKYTAADIMVTQEPELIGKFEFMKPSLVENSFHIAFSKKRKNYSKLLKIFNEELKKMNDNGTLQNILNKHGLKNNLIKNNNNKNITLKIATVDNKDMFIMKKLSKEYEKNHPNIKIKWYILDENILRNRLLGSLAISEYNFDIMTIGNYEAPLWGEKGWLIPIENLPKDYDLNDILKPVREDLSYNNKLYALPFYAESIMTYYRKDIFDKKGIKMPDNPTYDQIEKFVKQIHDPDNELYGIGLRGKYGWGENMSFINTLIHFYGGQWFDNNWNITINSPEWKKALSFYVNLMKNYSSPDFTLNGFNELKQMFSDGKLGIWIDATVAAGILFDPNNSKVYNKIAFASSPYVDNPNLPNWLWVWALAIPTSSKHVKEAQNFIQWATSKEYINLVGKTEGWIAVPPGTRNSTYTNKNYLKVAPFAKFVLSAIKNARLENKKMPYRGIPFIGIPEFPAIGGKISIEILKIFEKNISIEEALESSQKIVEIQMKNSKYLK